MYHPDGIEVSLQPADRNEKYHEFVVDFENIGEPDKHDPKRFIEVTTGERFIIVVTIHPNFSMYSATGVTVSLNVDADQKEKMKLKIPKNGVIPKDRTQPLTYRLAHQLLDSGGAYREHTWSFAELGFRKGVARDNMVL